MNGEKFYDKAAQLLDRAIGQEELMRNFYEDLARSYYRLAWEADHRADKRIEQAPQELKTLNADEMLVRLMRLAVNHSMTAASMDQSGGDGGGAAPVSPPN